MLLVNQFCVQAYISLEFIIYRDNDYEYMYV